MLSPDFISFQHSRALTTDGALAVGQHDIAPQVAPTLGLTLDFPGAQISTEVTSDLSRSARFIYLTTGYHGLCQLAYVGGINRPSERSLSIIDSTWLYHTLFKPEHSQLLTTSCLWDRGAEKASRAQDWVTELARPSPALRAPIVAKFNELAAEWRSTRNPIGSVLDMCTNFAYQRIIGMGQDAVPLILRELERSTDHWFWALGAITGTNPIVDEHRGRLEQMAHDWFSWARKQGYQW